MDPHISVDSDPVLGTLEWIPFNPNYLTRISTVETLILVLNSLFFSLFEYPYIILPMRVQEHSS